ncbi:FtsX-like permease family protein [Streptomyces sp. NPDC053427]|uniref:FtsX-like permease family protein n=1 Tax=Streptomyces sp. NPDC053427 TaxID=3365701 RepID=UPI0037CFA42F
MPTPMPTQGPTPNRARGPAAVRWCRDLAMGARFAVTGGRKGFLRTALTALGVGLGVAVLLLAAAIPDAMNAALARDWARSVVPAAEGSGPTDRTLLISGMNSAYRDAPVHGMAVRAEGPHAPVPPGLSRIPGPGEMAVSPALADLLASPDGALLKERFPHLRITDRIADAGLTHPGELLFYEGSDALRGPGQDTDRITGFGQRGGAFRASPLVVLAIVVGCVALLAPVAVFIATAVRFGGERRDRRLAALRLVGADRATTRRIAAGEALAGALLGLLTGAVFFLAARHPLSALTLSGRGVFPSDVTPDAALTAFIALAVPACAVGVTLFTMRRVTVEPLGVTRTAPPLRRRLWWRPLLPAAGVALLLPQAIGGLSSGDAATIQTILGTSLLLLGVAALLPWLLDAAVARLGRSGRGSQSWHLAVRRLELTGTTAARSVSGITVAVAGALAVQLLLNGVGIQDPAQLVHTRWTVAAAGDGAVPADRAPRMYARLSAADGVRTTHGLITSYAGPAEPVRDDPHGPAAQDPDPEPYPLTVADCATLRELARIASCSDGDAFLVEDENRLVPRPGQRLLLDPVGSRTEHRRPAAWTVPATARHVAARHSAPPWFTEAGLFATPGALDATLLRRPTVSALLFLDPARPDALDHVRNAAARIDPRIGVLPADYDDAGDAGDDILGLTGRGLTAGAVAVLLLIGCGLLLTTLEQLHDRARLLSHLDALGTPRAVLGRSVLWGTALPVVLGLALALTCGLSLGALLLHMAGRPLQPDWLAVLTLTGTAATVILGVTALSLPLLWRLMRPEGLRTE